MFKYGFLQGHVSIPQARLRIYNPSNNSMTCEVDAIVDSGALMSCIPESFINQLGRLEYKLIGTRGFDQQTNRFRKSRISIKIVDTNGSIRDCGEIEVIAVPGKEYALIGRDILNNYKVVLDAINGTWRLDCKSDCDHVSPSIAVNE